MENEVSQDKSLNNMSTPLKPAMKKFSYKSPLSGLRATNVGLPNPTTDTGFKPLGVSSPKHVNNGTGDRFAINVTTPHVNRTAEVTQELERTPPGLMNQGCNSSSSNLPSLVGIGGQWRGPRGNDMTPNNRNKNNRHGFRSSPTPDERGGQWNSPQQRNSPQRSGGFRGHNDSYGQNSFRPRQSNHGQNSFGNQRTPYSPQGRFNSSDRSHNSSYSSGQGNRGGNHNNRSVVDISRYYHPSMTSDPWAMLIQDKMNESSFQLMSPIKSPFMNLSNDTSFDTGLASAETDLVEEDS